MQLNSADLRFSVIIPTYNRLDYLKFCLASVRAQMSPPHEIIVVDDGSTDGTVDWVNQQEEYSLIVQENSGPGAARNAGARLATGNYLAFLDSDDLWMPWSLSTFERAILDYGRPKLVFAGFVDFSDPEALSRTAKMQDLQVSSHPNFLASRDHGFFAGAGMMTIEREAFLRAGGFVEDRMNGEDHDLVLRLGLEEGFVKVLQPTLVGHRVHDSNEMSSVEKSVAGLYRMIAREKAATYPGGKAFSGARRKIISHHCRPQIISLIRSDHTADAWRLFRRTLKWHVELGRFKFLVAAALLLLKSTISPARKG